MGGSFACMGVYLLLFLLPFGIAFEPYLLLQILGELSSAIYLSLHHPPLSFCLSSLGLLL